MSLVIPCLNEAATIGVCVERAVAALGRAKIAGQVIVADNGSTDGSERIAAEFGATVIRVAGKVTAKLLCSGFKLFFPASLAAFLSSDEFDECDCSVRQICNYYTD